MDFDSYNRSVLALWEEHHREDSGVRVPLLYPPMESGAIVFVGFNPSFSDRGWGRLSQFWPDPSLDPNEFFAWRNRSGLDIELAGKLERIARERYAYFKPERELAASLCLPWEHLDVFAVRERDQRRTVEQVFSDRSNSILNSFGKAQFRLFENLLKSADALTVVVSNALASRVYVNERSPEFDADAGCYFDRLGNRRVPVFFSGMLTGQRALDEFSRERLFWQVAQVLGREWRPSS